MAKHRRQANRHGFVIIDKPAGWTSHDVVARVRRIVGERRVGHAGTLDPAAVGVLPVAVGLATRTVEYLADASKAYRVWIRFGITTDSADGDGELIESCDATGLTLDIVEHALEPFRGAIFQRPPMHSAIKVDGKRLYELARTGVEINVQPREITIHNLRVVNWTSPELCIDVECSKGTYIRSLARDLGEAVGTGAYLSHLVRTRTGPFHIGDALTLTELESSLERDGWPQISYHPDWVLGHLTALVLDQQQAIDWDHGKLIAFESTDSGTSTVRVYDVHGRWLGVGTVDEDLGAVRPTKVIPAELSNHVKNTAKRSLQAAPSGRHIVSIGTFDGVHIGHQHLLKAAAERAAELGLPFLVVTFEPNPAQVIRPESFRGRLNTAEQKLERLRTAGVGDVVVVPFTTTVMHQTPEQFLGELAAATHPVEVWVGEEFALGHNRSGNVPRLTAIGRELGFDLRALPRRSLDSQIVSSSGIRQHILDGSPELAEPLLGYPYRISGEVVKGAQIGRTIGFPTANVEPPELLVPLPDGIYASLAQLEGDDEVYWAMTYIGTRPALNTGPRSIETNILDFDGDIYGRTLHTDFVARLRPDATFDSVDELVAQLKQDETDARNVLASYAPR